MKEGRRQGFPFPKPVERYTPKRPTVEAGQPLAGSSPQSVEQQPQDKYSRFAGMPRYEMLDTEEGRQLDEKRRRLDEEQQKESLEEWSEVVQDEKGKARVLHFSVQREIGFKKDPLPDRSIIPDEQLVPLRPPKPPTHDKPE